MRIATKYSMDDVQRVIVHAIKFDLARVRGKTVELLAFIAEFPDYIPGCLPIQLFLQICSIAYHPTADDLRPLMAHPALVALVMQCREGFTNPSKAIWSGSPFQDWLKEQFKSLGFNPEVGWAEFVRTLH